MCIRDRGRVHIRLSWLEWGFWSLLVTRGATGAADRVRRGNRWCRQARLRLRLRFQMVCWHWSSPGTAISKDSGGWGAAPKRSCSSLCIKKDDNGMLSQQFPQNSCYSRYTMYQPLFSGSSPHLCVVLENFQQFHSSSRFLPLLLMAPGLMNSIACQQQGFGIFPHPPHHHLQHPSPHLCDHILWISSWQHQSTGKDYMYSQVRFKVMLL